jgi:restriction endonuclease S subunit
MLREQKQRVGSADAEDLPLLGVSNAKGLHRSDMRRISDMSRYLRVERDWFAYNPMRINVGSLGWAETDALTGVISPDYVVFSCTERIEPRLVYLFLKHRRGLQAINSETAGSVRERLYFQSLSRIEIPLPPREEQRRLVGRVEALAGKVAEAKALRQEAERETEALVQRAAASAFPTPSQGVVGDFVRLQTGYAFKSEWFSQSGVRLARNANVGHGRLDWGEVARIPVERVSEFAHFQLNAGDILVSLDRPIISTGVKVARVREEDLPCLLLQRVARVQFRDAQLLPDYFFHWLRSPCFAGAIDPGRSNGVPHISHKDIEKIPFSPPPLAEQREIVARLEGFQMKANGLKRLQTEALSEMSALLPAVLDRAFKGEL